jgi:hypothetical protein
MRFPIEIISFNSAHLQHQNSSQQIELKNFSHERWTKHIRVRIEKATLPKKLEYKANKF